MTTTPHPISLSAAQASLIQQAAAALPLEWRSRFLESLADALLPHDSLSDDVVAQAATAVISRLFDGKVA